MTSPVQREKGVAHRRPGSARAGRVTTLLACLALGAPAAVGVAAISGMDNRLADILAQLAAPALTATILFTFIAALLRLKSVATAGLGVVLLLAVAVFPQWRPSASVPLAGAASFRLYSANLYYRNDDLAAMRRSIEAADADVVILIELGREAVAGVDQLLAGYPHRASSLRLDRTRGPSRSVIASRFPLAPLRDPPDGLHAVAARVQSPLGPLTLIGVHLTRPWPFQNSWGQISQTMALDEMTAGLPGPVVIAGDFNSVSSARIGRQVRTDIGLLPAPAPLGTWPSDAPPVAGIAIDHVYASPELAFLGRRLGKPNGSDHRPVVTQITRAQD